MATEGILQFSVASVVEDVLKQQGKRLSDIDLASRKAEEASMRRYEAAGWLRKMVGVVGGKDLPAEPSEEGFRLGLRSGIILCNVLNKIQPGAVPKVVEAPSDSVVASDGAALSAYQYFENVRNFLVAVEEMGLPTFEFSDLEQGGKSSRILNCVLALKSYSDWKQGGGSGSWKLGGNSKPANSGKHFVRKNSEPSINSFSRNMSAERFPDSLCSEQLSCSSDHGNDASEMDNTLSLHVLVRELLADKKHDEIPTIVENMLSRVVEEFEYRIAKQSELMKTAVRDTDVCRHNKLHRKSASAEMMDVTIKMEDEATPKMEEKVTMKVEDEATTKMEEKVTLKVEDETTTKMEEKVTLKVEDEATTKIEEEECYKINKHGEESKQILKQHMLVNKQHGDIQKLRHSLHTAKEGIQLLQVNYQEEVNILGKHLHTLAHAASGYHRVLEENRKLYNQLQDLKGNIRVYCRVRPFLHGQPSRHSTVDHISEGSITVITPSKYGKEGRKAFSFNKVFGPSASQEEVFSDTQPLIRSVLDGYNVCIFAYGQTGSGKTFTMSGPNELTQESLGVNYRALGDLFLISEQRKDIISYEVCVQMIEIYNEQVRDLLVTDSSNKKLEIRKNSQKGINVPDANIVPVCSTSDVIHLMNLGHKNRAVGSTAMNDRSSRSHSCLMVHVEGRDQTSGSVIRGCLNLIDLAGSERVDKSEVVGGRLKEAQHINKSLAALGDVISSLAQKNSHVPYRNSKLTQLLQDSLGGQAKTLMFVHISPEPDAIGETLSTLKFAERVATVELGAARNNKESADVKELKDQIASLKAALARKEEEPEHLQHSRLNSPDGIRMKSAGCSPSPSWQSLRNSSDNQRQPMEDGGNIEVRNNSIMKFERQNSDLQDLLISPPWPPVGTPVGSPGLKEDEKEVGSGNWVDKIMVNKQDKAGGDENHLVRQEEESRQLPEMFYQKISPDNSKIYPDQSLNKFSTNKKDSHDCDAYRNRSDAATTDESDDHDAATSDSSEPDLLWQLNLPKVSNIPNGPVSKIKRPVPKQSKIPEPRSLIPVPGTRRLSGGGGTQSQKTGRQLGSVDGKRKAGGGK